GGDSAFSGAGGTGWRGEAPHFEAIKPRLRFGANSASGLLKWLNSLYRPALPEGIRGQAGPPLSGQVIGASPSGKAVDFDSTIRRFESSRPSQHLANKIKRFLYFWNFHSEWCY